MDGLGAAARSGAVSWRNRSSAAAIAAASSAVALGATSSIEGRGGFRLPLLVIESIVVGFADT
jgi:hypothetical protein